MSTMLWEYGYGTKMSVIWKHSNQLFVVEMSDKKTGEKFSNNYHTESEAKQAAEDYAHV